MAMMPLSVLADRLTLAPPSLAALVDLVERSETMMRFLELVREFLPEDEREIMAGQPWERVEAFRRRFEARYFPLADFPYDDEESMEYLLCSIPVPLGGWTYDDYHAFQDNRPGLVLLMSLVIYPWVASEKEYVSARIPILEEVKRLVGPELAGRIPEEGWEPKSLHEVCDHTRFRGVADCADWICSCTGLWVLDTNYEEFGEEPWQRETVDELARQYPLVRQLMDRVQGMIDWLEDSPTGNFARVLNHILGSQVPREQLPLRHGGKTLLEVFGGE